MINQDLQQEYETRILVFKVNDNTIYDCSSLVKYDLKMFKGTRKEFDTYYLEHVGNRPIVDYMVYNNKEQIDKVEHGHCDRNIKYYQFKSRKRNFALGLSRYGT